QQHAVKYAMRKLAKSRCSIASVLTGNSVPTWMLHQRVPGVLQTFPNLFDGRALAGILVFDGCRALHLFPFQKLQDFFNGSIPFRPFSRVFVSVRLRMIVEAVLQVKIRNAVFVLPDELHHILVIPVKWPVSSVTRMYGE